jgi:hypothetical protein
MGIKLLLFRPDKFAGFIENILDDVECGNSTLDDAEYD